jgi:hypothetical protein
LVIGSKTAAEPVRPRQTLMNFSAVSSFRASPAHSTLHIGKPTNRKKNKLAFSFEVFRQFCKAL